VFWVKPCEKGSSHHTTPPPSDSSHPTGGGGGTSGGGEVAGPSLPITGAPVAAVAGLGMALIAAGAGLVFIRRRVQS
jgi:LPXTG-motif cell wall-anchored protein